MKEPEMTYTITVRTAGGRAIESRTVHADQVDAVREEFRQAMPHGSSRRITVK
jgi:hypothetical protein